MEDPFAVVREAAARALDLTAPEPALLKLVKDKDDAVRAAAAWALRARAGQRELRPLLKDPFASVRVAALAATGNDSRLRSLALGYRPPAPAAMLPRPAPLRCAGLGNLLQAWHD